MGTGRRGLGGGGDGSWGARGRGGGGAPYQLPISFASDSMYQRFLHRLLLLQVAFARASRPCTLVSRSQVRAQRGVCSTAAEITLHNIKAITA